MLEWMWDTFLFWDWVVFTSFLFPILLFIRELIVWVMVKPRGLETLVKPLSGDSDDQKGLKPRTGPLFTISPLMEDAPFRKVVAVEWERITAGRKQAGIGIHEPVRGVCLSGGGIRSACFATGVLEYLEEHNLFRTMDYMSSVSGGGYAACGLVTRLQSESRRPVNKLVKRFHHHSNYLSGNNFILIDLVLSVIATMANNVISCVLWAIVIADITAEFFHFMFPGEQQWAAAEFILLLYRKDSDRIFTVNSVELQSLIMHYLFVGVLLFSTIWVLVYGSYVTVQSVAQPHAANPKFIRPHVVRGDKRHANKHTRIKLGRRSYLDLAGLDDAAEQAGEESNSPAPTIQKSASAPALDAMNYFTTEDFNQSWTLNEEEIIEEVEEEDIDDLDITMESRQKPLGFLLNDLVLSYTAQACVLSLLGVAMMFVIFAIMRLLVYVKELGESHSTLSDAVNVSIVAVACITFCSVAAGGRALANATTESFWSHVIMSLLGSAALMLVNFILARFLLWRLFLCPFYVDTCNVSHTEHARHSPVSGCECTMPQELIAIAQVLLLVVHVWLSDPLHQALHEVYRRRLVSAFFKNAQDMPFSDAAPRPYFLCNVIVNNLQIPALGSRIIQPVFLSKDFCGGSSIGYWDSKNLNVHLSKGLALSGAAIQPSTTNVLVKFSMMLLGMDLGEWFLFRRTSNLRRYSIRIFGTIPFALLLLGQHHTDYTYVAYGTAVIFFVVPIVLMLGWGVVLQYSTGSYSNWFLFVPFFKRIYHVLGFLSNRTDPYLYLTDGGFFDNLGLYELLRRGVHDIFVFDAGKDPKVELKELFKILTIAEEELGCTIDFEDRVEMAERSHSDILAQSMNPEFEYEGSNNSGVGGCGGRPSSRESIRKAFNPIPTERPNRNEKSRLDRFRHDDHFWTMSQNCFVRFSVLYPKTQGGECRRGRIWYAKTTMTGREPEWVKLFAAGDRNFPHHNISNQMFDRPTFMAYSRLGKFAAENVFNDWKQRTPPATNSTAGSPCTVPEQPPVETNHAKQAVRMMKLGNANTQEKRSPSQHKRDSKTPPPHSRRKSTQ